jgi:hypothetical protein
MLLQPRLYLGAFLSKLTCQYVCVPEYDYHMIVWWLTEGWWCVYQPSIES